MGVGTGWPKGTAKPKGRKRANGTLVRRFVPRSTYDAMVANCGAWMERRWPLLSRHWNGAGCSVASTDYGLVVELLAVAAHAGR